MILCKSNIYGKYKGKEINKKSYPPEIQPYIYQPQQVQNYGSSNRSRHPKYNPEAQAQV